MRTPIRKGEETTLKLRVSTTVAVAVGLVFLLGCEWAGTRAEDGSQTAQEPAVVAQSIAPVKGRLESSPFGAVAEKVMPAGPRSPSGQT